MPKSSLLSIKIPDQLTNPTWKQLQLATLGAQAHGDLLVPAGVDNHHLEEERLQKYACILFCDGVYENFHLLQTCD